MPRRGVVTAWLRGFLLAVAPGLVGCFPLNFPPPADVAFEFDGTAAAEPPVIDAPPQFESRPVFGEIPGRSGSHAPTLTALPDGELLAAWYSYVGPEERDGAAIYLARRPAGADAWDPPRLHRDRPAAEGNPVLYSEAEQVWLFHAVTPGGWSVAHVEWQRSSDRGHTWSPPRILSGPAGTNVRASPLRTAENRLLLPAYDDFWQRALFFESADGETWSWVAAIYTAAPFQNSQPAVVRLGSGRLLALLRNRWPGWLWVTASDDGGRSWAAPRNSGFPNPGSPAAVLRLDSGRLVLIFNANTAARTPLSIALSGDDGATWLPARTLVAGEGAYAYPAAVQTTDGLIHVLYSHDRQRIQHLSINEAWVAGHD